MSATFNLTFTTPSRRQITVAKNFDQRRATITGLNDDPELSYSAEDARDLSALFDGIARLLA